MRRRQDIDEVIDSLVRHENLDPASFAILTLAKFNG
jgi:hypothetical protein